MQKIFIDRSETPVSVVEKILKSAMEQVTLVIPRDAAVSASEDNFSLLKREADVAGKELSIESVDEAAIVLARRNGLNAVHPLFASGGERMLTDIIPARKAAGRESVPAKNIPKISIKRAAKTAKIVEEEQKTEPEKLVRKLEIPVEANIKENKSEEKLEDDFIGNDIKPRRSRVKATLIFVAALVVIVGGAWGVGKIFGKTRVTLEFKQTEWDFSGPVQVRTNNTSMDAVTKTLPGEVFNDHRNLTNIYQSTGRVSAASKARGKITIYNAFGTAAQALVATTRFTAPDGKIFRLVSAVTVPGAKTQNGKIVPASVDADIMADQAGAAYNVGPIDKLTIPGFQGTPKYNGFYGSITAPLSGGSDTETLVATDADIAEGKQRTQDLLKSSLNTGIFRNQPNDFVIIDGASKVNITKLAVVSSTGETGKFGVFGEGDINAIAFRAADMDTLLTEIARASSSDDMMLKNVSITYSNPVIDFAKGTMTVTVSAKGTLTGSMNYDDVKKMLAGKGVADAQSSVLTIPNLSRATISMWPVWLTTVPGNTDHILIQSNQ
ncbi:MAG: hypothetical protein V1489_01135 [Candidatus Liptonbacteria bacterium]